MKSPDRNLSNSKSLKMHHFPQIESRANLQRSHLAEDTSADRPEPHLWAACPACTKALDRNGRSRSESRDHEATNSYNATYETQPLAR